MRGYAYIHTGTYRGQKGASDYLQLELQAEQHGCGMTSEPLTERHVLLTPGRPLQPRETALYIIRH